MRGIATVIATGFVSIILFGIFAPAMVEPIADAVVAAMPANSAINGSQYQNRLYQVLFVWAPLFVLGAGVASAVVWYFRRERASTRVRR